LPVTSNERIFGVPGFPNFPGVFCPWFGAFMTAFIGHGRITCAEPVVDSGGTRL
jgi:hypothetical protein